jgi:uncharacterized RDD family membrane protein YckC
VSTAKFAARRYTGTSRSVTANLPPPAGLVRRIGAFFIDLVILTIALAVAGFLFGEVLASIASYTGLIGFVLAFLYFGLLNSRICEGRTPGKRALNLTVSGAGGHLISVPRSLVRGSVLAIIVSFGQWNPPFLSGLTWLNGALSTLVLSLSAIMAYLLLFNRKAGQCLDDLLADTYVVCNAGRTVANWPATPQKHKLLAGLLFAVVIGVSWVSTSLSHDQLLPSAAQATLVPFQAALAQDSRFLKAGVTDGYQQRSGQRPVRSLTITIVLPNDPGNEARHSISQEVAALADHYLPIGEYDAVGVQIVSGYDLGLVAYSRVWLYVSPDDWFQMAHVVRVPFLHWTLPASRLDWKANASH